MLCPRHDEQATWRQSCAENWMAWDLEVSRAQAHDFLVIVLRSTRPSVTRIAGSFEKPASSPAATVLVFTTKDRFSRSDTDASERASSPHADHTVFLGQRVPSAWSGR